MGQTFLVQHHPFFFSAFLFQEKTLGLTLGPSKQFRIMFLSESQFISNPKSVDDFSSPFLCDSIFIGPRD